MWLDIVKLLAIFLVLWGHCAQHLLTTEEWSNYIYIYIHLQFSHAIIYGHIGIFCWNRL